MKYIKKSLNISDTVDFVDTVESVNIVDIAYSV